MTLRKRTLTIIGIAFVSLTAILYLTAQNIFWAVSPNLKSTILAAMLSER